jgi:hypothetical protein
MRQAIVTLIKTPKGNQQEAATRHPGYRYFDTTVPRQRFVDRPGKIFSDRPKDFRASFVSPRECSEISWHNGLWVGLLW